MHQANLQPRSPYVTGDSGASTYRDFMFAVSQQCPGYAKVLIPAKTAEEIAAINSTGIIPGRLSKLHVGSYSVSGWP